MLTDKPLEGGGYARAFREDAMTREVMRMDAIPPAEAKAQERALIAWRFEQGDHQPDGSVRYPWQGDKKAPDPWIGQGGAVGGGLTQQAVADMQNRVASQVGQLTGLSAQDRKVFDQYGVNEQSLRNKQHEALQITLTMVMPRDVAQRLHGDIDNNPRLMELVLRDLQDQAAEGVRRAFGIDVRPSA